MGIAHKRYICLITKITFVFTDVFQNFIISVNCLKQSDENRRYQSKKFKKNQKKSLKIQNPRPKKSQEIKIIKKSKK